MSLSQAFEDSIKSFVREELTKREVDSGDDHIWSREQFKWSKKEEKVLIQRVSNFLDHCALAHRRTRGGITARLNKLLKANRLCELRNQTGRAISGPLRSTYK